MPAMSLSRSTHAEVSGSDGRLARIRTVGEVRDHLMWWFADRRHDKNARDDVDLNMAAKWKVFCGGVSLD